MEAEIWKGAVISCVLQPICGGRKGGGDGGSVGVVAK